ncbi:MAG: fibronectin type III domain-containing protein, partial [Bdellovibrionales bacterium]|nr:fibronectin type III domain-containing protein [Bdellovibrionales bacterium]
WSSGSQDVSSLADSASITITADHSTATQAVVVVSKNTSTPSIANLTAPSTLSNSVNLSWSLIDPGGFTINDFQIQFRALGASTWLPFSDGINTLAVTTVDQLTASTSYEFRVRVKYNTSSFSSWSTPITALTKPNDPLFSSPYKAMNVGGATTTNVVAFYDNTYITLNGVTIPQSPLTKGQVVNLTTSQYDIIDADQPIYTAGRRGSGGNTSKANITWSPTSWAGKSFSFNAIRNSSQELYVFATEDAEVEVKQGSTTLATVTIAAGTTANLSWSTYGSYQVVASGTVLAYHISTSNGTQLVDPKPLLPSSYEIIGFPSSSMRLTTERNATNYNLIHSNSNTANGNLNKQDVITISPFGTSSLYNSESLLIQADQKISGASFADSNGNCAAPFLPTNLMKKRFVLNADTEWIAFASKQTGTVEVYSPSQTIGVDTPVQTLSLTNSGANSNAPFRARFGARPAGYRFVVDVPAAAWYEPSTDAGAANDDETILYGSD